MINLNKTNDSITQAGALVAISCLPFYTLGQLGEVIPMWIASVLGGAGLLIFVVRLSMILFTETKPVRRVRVEQGLIIILGFAIPLGVMEAIVGYARHTSELSNYIFAGLILLVGIVIMFTTEHKE